MLERKGNIVVLLLILVILFLTTAGYPAHNINSISHSETCTCFLTSLPGSVNFNFQNDLFFGMQESYRPFVFFLMHVLMIAETGVVYSMILLFILLFLWFYRRFEIKRIKRLNLLQNQSAALQENKDLKEHTNMESADQIDQCLTGMCDIRLCFFKSDGNVIYTETNTAAGVQKASADLLRTIIDADKFCEHLCSVNENQSFPLTRYISKEYTSQKISLPKLSFSDIQVKPDTIGNKLNHSINSFDLNPSRPPLQILDSAISPVEQDFILKATKTVKNNFSDYRFSVEQLAWELNMSVSQLNRKLNALTGQTAGRLISSYRLEYALECLVKTTDTISEVCFNSGYNGLAYFSRAFKRKFGCTPSVYRQLMTKKSISVHK